MDERRWPKLTDEEKDRILKGFKKRQEEGSSQGNLRPSPLALEWNEFVFAEFPEHEGEIAFLSPPEFVRIGLATLDAFATAVLASEFPFETMGILRFRCDLGRFSPGPEELSRSFSTVLVFTMDSDHVGAELESGTPSVIDAFKFLLSALDIGIYEGLVHPRRAPMYPRKVEEMLPADPCLFEHRSAGSKKLKLVLDYPGQMVPEKSPYLKDRPAHLWPSVSLVVTPTRAIRSRAREVLAFLISSPDTDGAPN
ncbi:MAG: hypothetical protein WCC27_04515 [Acidobacteriaceae bacterium]